MTAAPERTLYLIAYDIADPKRLTRVHKLLNGWKVSGQKSFYECWMTPGERAQVMREVADLIEPGEDRIHLFQLDPRQEPRCYGTATHFDEHWFAIL
jgi:CRISPR-associated protein Cas2